LIAFGFVDSDLWLSALIVVFVVVEVLASLAVKSQRQLLLYCPVEVAVVWEETAVGLEDLCLILAAVVLVVFVQRQYYCWELVEQVASRQGERVQAFESLGLQ